jgi:hypothetical protein
MAERHLISTKVLGRRIGDSGLPDKPSFDGDGDGFITNPVTGEDDIPAPISAVEKFAEGAKEHLDRFRKTYKQDPLDGDGDCYEAANKLATRLWAKAKTDEERKRIKLVHGIPLGQGGDAKGLRYGHAWVEVEDEIPDYDEVIDGLPEEQAEQMRQQAEMMKRVMQDPDYRTRVMDHSNGREIELPRAAYYGIGNIDKKHTRYYSFEDMLKMIEETGHYGPWE